MAGAVTWWSPVDHGRCGDVVELDLGRRGDVVEPR